MLTISEINSIFKRHKTIVLDGGLASELERYGHDLNHDLWSARLLLENPDAIKTVHRSFLEAGCMCIATASYQASVPGLVASGLSTSQANDVLLLSIQIAKESVAEFNESTSNNDSWPLVAASLGSYGAYLADGSEYRGNFDVSKKVLYDFHAQRLETIYEGNPDLVAFETIPCRHEAEVIRDLMDDHQQAIAWLSFSCSDQMHLCDGTRLSDAANILSGSRQIFAVGVNCTAPTNVSSLIQEIQIGAPDKRVAVYPNSGQQYDIDTRSWTGKSDAVNFGEMAKMWHGQGATLIGGCCQTGPEHVQEIRLAIETN